MSFGGVDIDDTLDDTMEESTYDIAEEYNEYDDVFASPEDGAEPQPADGLRKELVMTVVDRIPATQYLRNGVFSLSDPSATPTVSVP